MITNNGLAALSGGLDIFQALWNNDMTALDALLRSGVDTQSICEDKNMTDFKGKSPLGCALAWENFTAAEMLLRGGADPNFRDAEERTAFAVWMSNRRHDRRARKHSASPGDFQRPVGNRPFAVFHVPRHDRRNE